MPNNIDVIVEEIRTKVKAAVDPCVNTTMHVSWMQIETIVKEALTQLSQQREDELAEVYREIISQADLTPYAEEHNGELVDCSFYQIYKGKIEALAQTRGIDISDKTDTNVSHK